ncbi:MAG TPA: hypothetical protein ENO08_05865, partial [Candidatus Eisenbacteria bacterium]|nr:hypothetical protein [Candidatus Eisenbacteria bacterium]
DKLIFKLFYIEILPLEALVLQLRWNDPRITTDDIVQSIQRIEALLDPRYLKNLEEKNRARKRGIRSSQLAYYLIDMQIRDELHMRYGEADAGTLEKEVDVNVRLLREKISGLREDEQKILHLRFEQGLSAKAIAEEMEIGQQRRVYTIIDRILRKLRKSLEKR